MATTPRKTAVKAAAKTVRINDATLAVTDGQVDASKVAEVAARMATRHGWCDEVTKALQDMGVVAKPEMKNATVTVTFTVEGISVPGGVGAEEAAKKIVTDNIEKDLLYNRWHSTGIGGANQASFKVDSITVVDPAPPRKRAARKTAPCPSPARRPRSVNIS